jgi:hypothetical protein
MAATMGIAIGVLKIKNRKLTINEQRLLSSAICHLLLKFGYA